jgi:flagellar hook assembly protein FlgD
LDVTYEHVSGIADGAPGAQLLRNSPNPFGASTTIPFALAAAGRATVRVFDVAGGLVAVLQDGPLPAGNHSVVWDGREATGRRVAPGVYFARLTTAETTATVRMTLAR